MDTKAKVTKAIVKLPAESVLLKAAQCVLSGECKCIQVKNQSDVVAAIKGMAGKKTDEHLAFEIKEIVLSAENTEEKCYRYIFIVEIIRKALYPKCEETKKKAKKGNKEFLAAEAFIADLDRVIAFKL